MASGTRAIAKRSAGSPLWSAGCVGLVLACLASRTEAGAPPVSLLPEPGLHALEMQVPDPTPAPQITSVHRKQMLKAALLSAAVPGLGEYYSGHRYRALASGTLEAGIWTSFATFKVQEHLRGERAIEYAVVFAGAQPNGDDDYYKAVGQFMRSDGPLMWNEFVRRRERDTGEIVGRPYFGDEGWAWTSVDRLIEYHQLRKGKLKAHDRARSAIAFAIANRIVSMVSVVQAVRSDAHHHKEESFGLKLELGTSPVEPLARVGLWNHF